MGSMTKYEENGQIRTYLKLVMVVGGERLGTGKRRAIEDILFATKPTTKNLYPFIYKNRFFYI